MNKSLTVILFLFSSLSCSSQSGKVQLFVCPPCNSTCDSLTFEKNGSCSHCGMQLITKTKNEKPMTICFYLQDGVEVLDFAGPLEVFSYAGFNVFTVSKSKDAILSQGVLKITPDYDLTNAPAYDILAVFGGNATNASNSPDVIKWIQSRQKSTQYYFSVCTGAFIIGKAGLLDSLTATTFHLSINDLQKSTPSAKILANTRFVDDGIVITTAGISAGIDGALHLVEKLKGKELAKSVAEYMEYDKWVPGQGLIINKKL